MKKRKTRRRPTLTGRVLLGVNIALVGVLSTFTIRDYHAAWDVYTQEKRNDLEDEAKILLNAITRLHALGSTAVQAFIDDSCSTIPRSASPGYQIVVVSGSTMYRPRNCPGNSAAAFPAILQAAGAPDGSAVARDQIIVAARAQAGDIAVYVAEYLSNLRRIGWSIVLRRMISILVVGLALGAVLNLVLYELLRKPLRGMAEVVQHFGRGQRRARMSPASTLELGVLADEFNRMAETIEQTETERAVRMEKARQIQRNLLPALTAYPGVRLACLFEPAAEVAGDFYDIVSRPDGRLLFCVADVTGHDVPAAMVAAMLKALLLSAAEREDDPATLASVIHKAFTRVVLDGDFATMILAHWDPGARTLKYISAGHEEAYLIRSGGTLEELAATGPLLGVPELSAWSAETVCIAPGDRLVLLTDGYRETFAQREGIFAQERVTEILQRVGFRSLDKIPEELRRIIHTYRGPVPPADDITVLLVEF